MQHLISLNDWSTDLLLQVLDLAHEAKKNPTRFRNTVDRKTLWMIFEKPSLRTRVSFEVAMTQMGGHAIYYDMSSSPLGTGKESVSDTINTVSRYVDVIAARLFDHAKLQDMAHASSVPVINALTDFVHPCQILADLFTIREHKGSLERSKLAYIGDANNNVTHSLLYGCAMTGIDIHIGCPDGQDYLPHANVLKQAKKISQETGSEIKIFHNPAEAVACVDIVYTDSWMSYHVSAELFEKRVEALKPYQVNTRLIQHAHPEAIFMNCLPALRGHEQTAEVIDGPQSVVFDQAENRLHVQKAIIIKLGLWDYGTMRP
ncbi:MAG: ornithine carbamoyltransferase [Kiritimatiellae bacterium]|nr:ornithine carbamoyltransferase [Kiritimatiellia bacterium]